MTTTPNITVIVTKILCLSVLIGAILVSQLGQKDDQVFRFLLSLFDLFKHLFIILLCKQTQNTVKQRIHYPTHMVI